jgi:hypothetical protein
LKHPDAELYNSCPDALPAAAPGGDFKKKIIFASFAIL